MAQLNPMLKELQQQIEQHKRESETIIDKVARRQNYITTSFVAFNIVVFIILQLCLGGKSDVIQGIPNTVLSMVATILLLLVSFPFASELAKKNLRNIKLNDENIKPSMNYAGEWKYETNFRIQTTPSTRGQFKSEEEYQRYKTNYERFEKNMTDYKEMGTSVWSQNIFELKIDFGNSTIKGDYPQVLWRSNPISYDEHELTWSFDGEIWWKDNKNYANKFSGIEHYSVKDHDEQGRPSRIEGHLVGTILVGEHFFVVDALSSFTRKE